MIDETKVEKALEYGLGQVRPSPDLLGRIQREAERVRPGLWARLRLGAKLEIAAACILMFALLGYAGYRNLYPAQLPPPAPVGGDNQPLTPKNIFSGTVSDANLHLIYTLEPDERGDWVLSSTLTNLSRSPMELWPECGNLVRVEGRIVKTICQPGPAVVVEPGVTHADEVHFSDEEIRNRTALVVIYSIPGQGPQVVLRARLSGEPEDPSAAVATLVETFGQRLQKVSLQASREELWRSIQEQYGDLIAHDLWARWQYDPTQAPGRLTSSPWPDHIRIIRSDKTAEGAYAVQGEIIEMTSTGMSGTRPINLGVERWGERWLIAAVSLGEYVQTELEPITYTNSDYGFTFTLPARWEGYTIVTEQWEGITPPGNTVTQSGPKLSIRHPRWTAEQPRQDIPIMIFTVAQWDALEAVEYHISAAGVPPRVLGRSAKYVFALPPRYNFVLHTGFEEVEQILKGNPVQIID